MGNIHDGEDHLHHADGSHRWLHPTSTDPVDETAWRERVRDHIAEHQQTMGGVAKVPKQRPRNDRFPAGQGRVPARQQP